MMGTLRNSSSKLFCETCGNRGSGFLGNKHKHAHIPPPRSLRLLLPFEHLNHVNLSLSISLQPKTSFLIFPLSSLSSPDKQTDMEKEEPEIEDIDQSKTVRVKFQLKKECSFGQQFLVVGDDPMIGLWNPINALQLNWSDGHVWTVELDLPIGKSIKFKFLLKGYSDEDFLWQPGPDRILQTWETDKTITVCEDWDNADLQKLAEEPGSNLINTSIGNPKTPIVAERTNVEEEEEEETVSISKKDKTIFGDNGRAMNVKDMESKTDEGKIGSYEGVPVLVLGLTPLPVAVTDEESINEVEKNFYADASDGKDDAEALDVPQMQVDTDSKEECENDSPSPNTKETAEIMFGDEQELCQDEETEKLQVAEEQDQTNTDPFDNGVLENDIQWGRKTLQKFLSNLGIL